MASWFILKEPFSVSFNSLDFGVFLVVVLALYWSLPHAWQNRMLLAASYFFYGYWDWRFLSLLALSSTVDYFVSHRIAAAAARGGAGVQRRKRAWLLVSLCTGLGILGFFKYFNFFEQSLDDLLANFGLSASFFHLNVILPVGVSFYTFQTLSYTIDVYRGHMQPAKSFWDFALYVSFFPQLVAGPIVRAADLLPQVEGSRRFSGRQFADGMHLIFWGLFKKIFVADNLALVVDGVFAQSSPPGFSVICGVYAFAFQIYCDFSGYSDIARGCAKCMGFELMVNFNHPYVAENPRDFWSRWHISLSTWLRDYLYISLGGNRRGKWHMYRNLAITMLLGGLWHGAAWKFVLWGAYQGALLIVHRALAPGLAKAAQPFAFIPAPLRRLIKVVFMFQLITFGWLIFRAQDTGQILVMAQNLFTLKGAVDWSLAASVAWIAAPLLIIKLVQLALRRDDLHRVSWIPVPVKAVAYSVLLYLVAFHGAAAQTFIYFQF